MVIQTWISLSRRWYIVEIVMLKISTNLDSNLHNCLKYNTYYNQKYKISPQNFYHFKKNDTVLISNTVRTLILCKIEITVQLVIHVIFETH